MFVVGSAFSGAAQSMEWLIAARAIQGVGAGGLTVTATALIGDVIPLRERGAYQGALGAVFGVTTIIGPLLGWLFHRSSVLALGVLRECADRGGRGRDGRGHDPGGPRDGPADHRLGRDRVCRDRGGRADAGDELGRDDVRVGVGADAGFDRRVFGGAWRCLWSSSGARRSRSCRCGCSRAVCSRCAARWRWSSALRCSDRSRSCRRSCSTSTACRRRVRGCGCCRWSPVC